MRPSRSTVLFPLALSACITSSPAEYGGTKLAKKTEMPLCTLLDDLEDGNNQIIKAGGRDGYWFSFADSEGTQLAPRGNVHTTAGGRPGSIPSQHHMRVTGRIADAGVSPYAGVGFALTNPKGSFDLSRAKGIQFWAKGPGRVRLKMPDVNTDPVGDRCSDCYNDFGVDLYLSDKWERYTVPFDKFEQQPGWGDRAPYVATGAVMAIQWQFTVLGEAFDLAFDDVALVGCDVPWDDGTVSSLQVLEARTFEGESEPPASLPLSEVEEEGTSGAGFSQSSLAAGSDEDESNAMSGNVATASSTGN